MLVKLGFRVMVQTTQIKYQERNKVDKLKLDFSLSLVYISLDYEYKYKSDCY